MAQIYPENTTYQNLNNAVQSTGRAAAAARKSSKAFPVQNYAGVSNTIANSTPSTTKLPTQLSSLGSLTTPYGSSTKYEAFHPGVDIANKIGTPIPAYASGTVIAEDSGRKQGDKGFGNTIVVQDDLGRQWRYSHLNNEYVKVGQKITAGSQIGTMGNSGSTYSLSGGTGSHLDLRIKDAYGKYINPNSLI